MEEWEDEGEDEEEIRREEDKVVEEKVVEEKVEDSKREGIWRKKRMSTQDCSDMSPAVNIPYEASEQPLTTACCFVRQACPHTRSDLQTLQRGTRESFKV